MTGVTSVGFGAVQIAFGTAAGTEVAILALGLACIRAAERVCRGEWRAQLTALFASVVLLGTTLPLTRGSLPATLVAISAAVALTAVLFSRTVQRTGKLEVVTRTPERTITVAEAFDPTSAASTQLI